MSTITPMTDDTNESSGTSSGTGKPAASSTADKPGPDAAGPGPGPGERLPGGPRQHAPQTTRAAERRSALVPVLSTIVGTLIVGAFSLAAIGFNVLRTDSASLRTDMNEGFAQVHAETSHLRTDMNERFAQVDARFAQIDQRFARIDATLLDHTDRLARIETVLDVRPLPAPQP